MNNYPEQFSEVNARRFQYCSIVENYQTRIPYSEEIFTKINSLLDKTNRIVLDIGTGTGEIARRIEKFAARVDAVDSSSLMLEKAKSLPNGSNPKINWIHSKIESHNPDINQKYALIIAGDSIHWMNWDIIFPLFKKILNGYLVLVTRNEITLWNQEIGQIIGHYSLIQNYQPINIPRFLQDRKYWNVNGEFHSNEFICHQSVDEYLSSFHSRTSLSIDDMTEEDRKNFDNDVKRLVIPYVKEKELEIPSTSSMYWGKPI